MRTVVAYDSTLSAVAVIAQRIAAKAAGYGSVEAGSLEALEPQGLRGISLLILGTSDDLHGGLVTTEARLRRWVDQLPSTVGVAAATFETGVGGLSLSGHAPATRILRALRARGCHVSTPAETFRTWSHGGELRPGEADRAAEWADALLCRTLRWQELRPAGAGRKG